MINIKVNFDKNKFEKQIAKALESQIQASLKERLEPIQDEIDREPNGKFIATMEGDSLIVKPHGFSEKLTEKINILFKD